MAKVRNSALTKAVSGSQKQSLGAEVRRAKGESSSFMAGSGSGSGWACRSSSGSGSGWGCGWGWLGLGLRLRLRLRLTAAAAAAAALQAERLRKLTPLPSSPHVHVHLMRFDAEEGWSRAARCRAQRSVLLTNLAPTPPPVVFASHVRKTYTIRQAGKNSSIVNWALVVNTHG